MAFSRSQVEGLLIQIGLDAEQAKRELDEFTAKVESSAKKAQKSADKIDDLKTAITGIGIAAASLGAAIVAIDKFAERSREIAGVRAGFDNLTRSIGESSTVMLSKLRPATRYLVSDLELMRQTNQAILLGIPVTSEKMADMATIATRLGEAVGLDAASALESLITGMGRQSKLMLDNLGILVDFPAAYERYAASIGVSSEQLTDMEKRQIGVNETLRVAKEKFEELGPAVDNFGNSWLRLKTGITDSTDALTSFLDIAGKGLLDNELINRLGIFFLLPTAQFAAGVENGRGFQGAAPSVTGNEAAIFGREDTAVGSGRGVGVPEGAITSEAEYIAALVALRKMKERLEEIQKIGPPTFAEVAAKIREANEQAAEFARITAPFFADGEGKIDPGADGKAITDPFGEGGFPLLLDDKLGEAQYAAIERQQEFDRAFENSIAVTQAFGDAWLANVQALVSGSISGGRALKNLAKAVLDAVAAEAIGKAAIELAAGFAASAIGDAKGAAEHFTSAALYGAVGTAVGIASALVGGGGGGGKRGGSGGSSSSSVVGTPTPAPTGPRQDVTVIIEGNGIIYGSPDEVARLVSEAIKRQDSRAGV